MSNDVERVVGMHDWQPEGDWESHPGGEFPHLHTACSHCGARAWWTEHQWGVVRSGCEFKNVSAEHRATIQAFRDSLDDPKPDTPSNVALPPNERAERNERAFHHLLSAAQQSVINDEPKRLHDGIREALAISHGEPVNLHFTNEWLREKIASDPDHEPMAGSDEHKHSFEKNLQGEIECRCGAKPATAFAASEPVGRSPLDEVMKRLFRIVPPVEGEGAITPEEWADRAVAVFVKVRHRSECWNDQPGAVLCQVCGGDMRDSAIAMLRAIGDEPGSAPKMDVQTEHVAWLRYDNHNGARPTTIHLCDSDAPGAFKVYRKADALLEEVRVFWPELRQLMDGFMNGDPNFTEWDHQVRNHAIELSFRLNGADVPPKVGDPK